MDPRVQTANESRDSQRVPLSSQVAIDFESTSIVGPGENISSQGVYFTAEGCVRVTVRIGTGRAVTGRLVRLESMGGGRVGLAVQFDEPIDGAAG